MNINPPDPILEGIDGDQFLIVVDYPVKFGYWLRQLQFMIPGRDRKYGEVNESKESFESAFKTDIASIPWWFRMVLDRSALNFSAPVVHDYLCKMEGRIKTLEGEEIQIHWFDSALLFLMLLRMDGISWPRALFAFLGVVIGQPKW